MVVGQAQGGGGGGEEKVRMNLVVQPPMDLIADAANIRKQTDCIRKQVTFELFPGDEWRISWVCGTNSGIGSDNGYGVGHHCCKSCKLRIPLGVKK